MAGSADSAHELYLARGADRVGVPLADEAEEVRWIPLADLPGLIATGQILGAATIIGAQHALLTLLIQADMGWCGAPDIGKCS
jgi:hypothetical protein